MKSAPNLLRRGLAHAALFLLALGLAGQEPAAPGTNPPPADPPPEKAAVPAPELRRIDEPVPAPPAAPSRPTRRRPSSSGDAGLSFGDRYVAPGNRVVRAVSILGSTSVDGEVDRDAVSILGQTRVGAEGRVGGAAVAVLGQLQLDGEVGSHAVNVLGRSVINRRVGGNAVVVLGDLELGPNAIVEGNLVVLFGKITRADGTVVRGNIVHVADIEVGNIDWLITYFTRCVLMGRPLAFGAHLGWAWLVAAAFLAFYVLLALLFPRGIEKAAATFETRPGYSILASVLTVFLSPVAIVLLAITVIGVVVIPFAALGLFLAQLFGKAVMLAWLGRRFTPVLGGGVRGHPVVAVLVGGVLVMLLYTIPVFGFLLYKLLTWLGLGVVVYTLALGMKREKPAMAVAAGPASVVSPIASAGFATTGVAAAAVTPAPVASAPISPEPVQPLAPAEGVIGAAPVASESVPPADPLPPAGNPPPPAASPAPDATPRAAAGVVPPVYASAPPVMPVVSAATLPRAGFLIRMGALLLDLILVGLLTGFVTGMLPRVMQPEPPSVFVLVAIYGAVMWKLRGTTIGGVVCGLKVVRLDERPIDWPTSCVRAVSCFLSMVVAGLGFIWIAIDDEKQAWHDKIAGTVVVRVPKGTSLL